MFVKGLGAMQLVDRFSFSTGTDAPRRAREAVAQALHRRGAAARLEDSTRDDIALAVSELVTNAVRHTDTRDIDVSVKIVADRVRVTVSDSSTEIPLIPAQSAHTLRPLPPAATAAMTSLACHGLLIVAALTDDWGTRADDSGKSVWFEIAC